MKTLFSALIYLLFAVGAFAQQADPLAGFTGKWAIDLKRTDFTRVPEWTMPRSFEIKQKKELVTIESKWYDQQMKQHYYTEYLSLDGTTNELILPDGGKRMASLQRNYQGNGFTLSVRILKPNGDRDREFTETWALEDDGKTLTIDRKAFEANDYSIKAYYNKQK